MGNYIRKAGCGTLMVALYFLASYNFTTVYSLQCTVREQNKTANDRRYHYSQQQSFYTYMICSDVDASNISQIELPRSYGRSVKYILFENSSINHLPSGVFSKINNVEVIYLNNSKIYSVEEVAFNGLADLKELYLQENYLREIKSGFFGVLPELQVLNLSFNKIRTIEAKSFSNLYKLKKLMLYDNYIETTGLNNLSFESLENLEYLDMSWNILNSVHGVLSKLTKLTCLQLSNNHMVNISSEFATHKLLKSLDLSYNSIVEIDGFNLPEQLQFLNISNNNLSTVLNISLLKEIENVDMNNNNIKVVKNDLLRNMDRLVNLQMQNNNLKEIPIGFFSGCYSIKLLNLSHNEISVIEYGLFSGLANLTDLDLSYNFIIELEADTFYSIPNLEYLDVSFNKIAILNLYKLGQHCRSLKTLNVSGNNFTCALLSGIIRDAKTLHFSRKEVQIVRGNMDNVTNIHGIPCRNTKNNNLLYSVVSSIPNSNYSVIKDLRKFFDDGFKNTTFYRFFTDSEQLSYLQKSNNIDNTNEQLVMYEKVASKLGAIQHLLIIVVIIILIYVILLIIKNVLYCRQPRRLSSSEPEFLL